MVGLDIDSDITLVGTRDLLLDGILGGELHPREKVSDSNPLPISHFTDIGQILRVFAQRRGLTGALLDRLTPHRSYIIGVLPPGFQAHGLISDSNTEIDDAGLRRLHYKPHASLTGEL